MAYLEIKPCSRIAASIRLSWVVALFSVPSASAMAAFRDDTTCAPLTTKESDARKDLSEVGNPDIVFFGVL